MKKTMTLSCLYIFIVFVFDCVVRLLMINGDYSELQNYPQDGFMLFFSYWIAAATIVSVLHRFISKREDCNQEIISDVAFYIKVRVVLIIVIMCAVWGTVLMVFPEVAGTRGFAFTQDNATEFRYTFLAKIYRIYRIFNFVTYLPFLVILARYALSKRNPKVKLHEIIEQEASRVN